MDCCNISKRGIQAVVHSVKIKYQIVWFIYVYNFSVIFKDLSRDGKLQLFSLPF